ncbi:hypothetical protein [uncultured Tateyamaria sp.]|uniref:hypothetical protein n=1 Tax=Tateyamaria sp. 1078 TaxID=3417464 RepID=UPI002616B144|nr:hypothetical protein [uncultured Tateyamaria sp.]
MREFLRSYRKHFDYDGTYPLTRFTSLLRVGDYGIFKNGKFEKRGHVSEWSERPEIFETEFGMTEAASGFASFHKSGTSVSANGNIGPVAQGKISFGFDQQGGCLLQLDGTQNEVFKHKQKVIEELKRFKGAKEFDVIFLVKRAASGILLVSESSEWKLEASGSDAVLNLGRLAHVGVSLTKTSGSGSITRVPEPSEDGTVATVAFEVYGTRWYDRSGIRRLGVEDSETDGEPKFGRVDLFEELESEEP